MLVEYELTKNVVPSSVNEDDIEHDDHKKTELGEVDDHRVVHYKSKELGGSHYTFVTNKNGETVGHIEHKPTKSTKGNRLAISNITKTKGAKFDMGGVLRHLIKHGHSLESDNTNTEAGAHGMLMRMAAHPDVHTHIEDGKGNAIPHEGDITSTENQKKYAVKRTDSNFLNDDVHKHVLVFGKK